MVARIQGKIFGPDREAKDEVIDWISFYNDIRLHLTWGSTSPMKFEKEWLATQLKQAA